MHHLTTHNIDQKIPSAVRDSIMDFLEEQATVLRMCKPKPTPRATPTLPDLNALPASMALSNHSLINTAADPRKILSKGKPPRHPHGHPRGRKLDPCYHCGGDHLSQDCTDEKAGTKAYIRAALQSYSEKTAEQTEEKTPEKTSSNNDANALVSTTTGTAFDDKAITAINDAFSAWGWGPDRT